MNVYGITNCDTVKEARQWLAERGVSHRFVDFKKTPPTRRSCPRGAPPPAGRRCSIVAAPPGRSSSPRTQARVVDERSAISLMVANPTAIRRPVVESEEGILVGFDRGEWERTFPG